MPTFNAFTVAASGTRWQFALALLLLGLDLARAEIVTLDLTRKREINGQLAIARSNLFVAHIGGASGLSATQSNYFFNTLDAYAGRSFGIKWRMLQVKEDAQRPGWWEDTTLINDVKNRSNSWVNAGRPGHTHASDVITTVHPDTYFPTAADITNALPNGFRTSAQDPIAEFVSYTLQRDFPRPGWFEVANEINGESTALGTTWEEICQLHATIAERAHAGGFGTKVVGFGGKWPAFEVNDFGIWNRDWVPFIDIAGASVDAYSVHLYQRTGANSEAIMDMINNYSQIALGQPRPLMITEYGHLDDLPTAGEEYWRNVSRQCGYLIQFMNRGGLMGRCIAFNTLNAQQWPSALLDPGNNWTDTIKLYELWKDFRGDRLVVSSDDPDILVHAVLDGAVARLAINNLTETSAPVHLTRIAGTNAVSAASISRLYYSGTSTILVTNAFLDPATTNLTLAARETVVLTYSLNAAPTGLEVVQEQTYFGNSMIQSITAGNPINLQINGVNTSNMTSARLRLSMGNITQTAAWTPAVAVNGTAAVMSPDQMGDPTDALRAREVDVPIAALLSNNTVAVTYPNSGGQLAGAVLVVTYGRLQDQDGDGLPDALELAHTLPPSPTSLIPENDDDGDGVSAIFEWAFGLDLGVQDAEGRPQGEIASANGTNYFAVRYRRADPALPFVDLSVLRATNLSGPWQGHGTIVTGTEPVAGEPGVFYITERSLLPMDDKNAEYLKVQAQPK